MLKAFANKLTPQVKRAKRSFTSKHLNISVCVGIPDAAELAEHDGLQRLLHGAAGLALQRALLHLQDVAVALRVTTYTQQHNIFF